jgi:hypothetical protein
LRAFLARLLRCKDCSASASTIDARVHSIEDYKDYWAGFVEFDDEGWLYDPHGQPTQMQVLQARLKGELNDPKYSNADFPVVAFVHGWHHNGPRYRLQRARGQL